VGVPVLYNVHTDRALAVLNVKDLKFVGVDYDGIQEFALTNESRITVYGGIGEQPKYTLNTND